MNNKANKINKEIKNHPMFSLVDYNYLREKGYINKEILAFWDRDHSMHKEPMTEIKKPFDIVGYLSQGVSLWNMDTK